MSGRFSIEAVFKAIDRFTRPLATMQAGVGRLTKNISKGVKEANAAIDTVGAGLQRVGAIAAATAAGIGAVVFNVGKTGADFEAAISNVGAVSLQTRDQIAELEKQAIALGGSTVFSATEVANAMELMARAGFSNAEIMSGVGGVLDAAAASGEGMAEVAGHLSSVLKGMGMQTTETARVADVLAKASSLAKTSIGRLGESMKQLGPVARQFNIPLEQAVGMAALLQDAGLDASQAGTSAASALTKLAKPSAKALSLMRQMGITFQDAKGNMLAPIQLFGQMAKAVEKSGGNMKQAAFFTELVGLESQKAALNLVQAFRGGKLEAMFSALENAEGTASKMASLRLDNLTGDIEQLGGAVDSLKIGLFQTQSGPLRGIVQSMTAWVEKNSELITSNVQSFLEAFTKALPTIGEWLERIGRAAGPILAVVAGVKAWAAAQALLTAAMAANPVTLWIVGLTALAALVAAFWPEISAFMSRVWTGVKDMASRAWEAVQKILVGVGEFVVGLLVLYFRPLMPIIGPILDALKTAAGIIMENWGPLGGFFAGVWAVFVEAARGAYETLLSIWSPIAAFFSGLWDTVVSGFKSAFAWVLDKLSWAVSAVRLVGRGVLGTGEEDGDGADPSSPQVVSPQERVAQSISETTNNASAEVTIRDQTGRAAVTKPPKGPGMSLTLQPSGAF